MSTTWCCKYIRIRVVEFLVKTQLRYLYKRRIHKRQNSTNVGPGQTSEQDKRRTGTNVGLVQTSDQHNRRTKEKNYLNFKIFFNGYLLPLFHLLIKI